jgi:hypothetical protein
MITFLGIIVLATRYEFTSQASLWSSKRLSGFYLMPAFGPTGMVRNRFDEIWK